MDLVKKIPAIIYLSNTKFDYYSNNSTAVLRFDYPTNAIRDLEVIDPKELENNIRRFTQTNALPPTNIFIILAESLLFQKEFEDTADKALETQLIQGFLDNIPFSNINTKVIKQEKGYRIIATNRDLYQSIKKSFEKLGFSIEAVVPSYIFGVEVSRDLDIPTAATIMKKIGLAKQNSLLVADEAVRLLEPQAEKAHSKKFTLRLIILIAVFSFLLLILGIVYYTSNLQNSTPKIKKQLPLSTAPTIVPQITQPIVILTPIDSVPTPTLAGALTFNLLRILIINTAEPNIAELVRSKLSALGVKIIDIQNAPSINSSKTLVVFSNIVTLEAQQAIENAVKTLIPNVNSQRVTQTSSDVIITIGSK